ncbi:glucosaminidase domain-containing protein [Spongiivirga sp. MCCC 1A20706]|uniref:glucosaminidase domain-containing protein n=1 Tax=Spongiivirga sp. MCCC 1A20706 TaxID=3160963 RepID=UPI00397739BC
MIRIGMVMVVFALLFSSCGNQRRVVENTKDKEKSVVKVSPRDTVKVYVAKRMANYKEYIATFKDIAMEEMTKSGIPASITLAQGLLESGGGNSNLSLRSNNHFGIKCHKGWKGYRVYHDDDEKGECFRKYTHPRHSFRDHSIFLTTRSRYLFLFSYAKDDYKKWARGLKKAGYATDRRYPQKLIDLINKYELYQYDALVLGKDSSVANVVTDDLDKYMVKKGDTLYSISRRFKISVGELKKLNGLETNDLHIGQVLFTKPLPKDF